MDNSTAWTAADHAIAERMSAYLVNFVSAQNPNGPTLPQWPVTLPAQPVVMDLGTNFTQIPITPNTATLANKTTFLSAFYATQPVW
jgi:para-nitrobenzyl esterase